MAKNPWKSQNFRIFVFIFWKTIRQVAKFRQKTKRLGNSVRAGICFLNCFFGARGGWRGVGFGASVRVVGLLSGCLFVFFFSSSSSSYARATRACTRLWLADLDRSSSPAAFCFSRVDKRHDELLFLVQGTVELTTIFRFFGFVLVF